MNNIPDCISNLAINALDRTGALGLSFLSPTTLLVSLILGPALLMVLHTVHVPAVFANIGTPATCQSCHELRPNAPSPEHGETAQVVSGAATSQVQVADDLNQYEYVGAGQCIRGISAIDWQQPATASADQSEPADQNACWLGSFCNWWRVRP